MSVSVVMAAYNAALYIDEAIRSVVAQSTPDWELIVVDDGSRDDTVAIARSYADDPRIRVVVRSENGGPAQARHDGTLMARYAYISYLDADDRLRPDTLQVLGDALIAAPAAVLAYGDFVRINARGRQFGLHRYARGRNRPTGDVLRAFLRNNHMPNGGCAVIRRDAILASNCWNSALICAEDWVAWTMLATCGDFVYVPRFKALEYRELITGLSHVQNIHFERALPSINAVYGDPRVTARFTPGQLRQMRSVRECNMWFYLASLNVRRNRWRTSMTCLTRAIGKNPRQTAELFAKYTLTALDRFF